MKESGIIYIITATGVARALRAKLGELVGRNTMFRISKKIKFEAAHILPNHEGKCGRLHGHSWEADIILEDTVLQELGSSAGMVCDYSHIKAAVADVWENKLDHHFLN